MIDRLNTAVDAALQALRLIFQDATHVGIGWLLLGLALHLIAIAVRTLGWHTILRASYPEARQLRRRDTMAAYFAGSGVNGVVPARGGDVLKLYMVHRRVPESRYSTLVATFVPETLFETVFGIALVAWALARGFLPVPVSPSEIPSLDVSLLIAHPIISSIVAGALGVIAFFVIQRLRRGTRTVLVRVRRGFAIFKQPHDYFTGVVTWQVLSRLIRLGSLACFMAAFALPVTVSTVVLVMAAQGGGRIIPLAPASTGLRMAMLSYGFVEVTGKAVDIAAITTFTVGVGAVCLLATLLISAGIIVRTFGTLSPRRAIDAARAAFVQRARLEPRAEGESA